VVKTSPSIRLDLMLNSCRISEELVAKPPYPQYRAGLSVGRSVEEELIVQMRAGLNV
jgi:hypothetical protein